MSRYKKKMYQNIDQVSYLQSPNTTLPDNYIIRDGFLFKKGTSVSLAVSGIVVIAAQGFLHVDETEEYKTK